MGNIKVNTASSKGAPNYTKILPQMSTMDTNEIHRTHPLFLKAKTTTAVVIKAEFAIKKKVVRIDTNVDLLFEKLRYNT